MNSDSSTVRKPQRSLLIIIVFLLSFSSLNAQMLSAFGTIGGTFVDEEAWAGQEPRDWNNTMSGFHLQAHFLNVSKLHIGAEVGYTYLFWYDIVIISPVTRQVDAWRVLALAQVDLAAGLFLEAGAGVYLFEDFTDPTVAFGLGYLIDIPGPLSIPLKARADIILDSDATLVPLGLSAGLRFNLK